VKNMNLTQKWKLNLDSVKSKIEPNEEFYGQSDCVTSIADSAGVR
jgi:hypothetical protein